MFYKLKKSKYTVLWDWNVTIEKIVVPPLLNKQQQKQMIIQHLIQCHIQIDNWIITFSRFTTVLYFNTPVWISFCKYCPFSWCYSSDNGHFVRMNEWPRTDKHWYGFCLFPSISKFEYFRFAFSKANYSNLLYLRHMPHEQGKYLCMKTKDGSYIMMKLNQFGHGGWSPISI